MKIGLTSIIILLIAFPSFAQRQGIQKGDNEITFNGSMNTFLVKENQSVSGRAFLSYGYYVSNRAVIGIAPGITTFGGTEIQTTTTYSLQLFSNINLAEAQPVIPYLRIVLYKFDLETEDTEYIQAGGGIKYFFAERAAWDTLLTYGTAISGQGGNTFLLLTGLSYIF